MKYTTLERFKQALGTTSDASDDELNLIIEAVSRAIDRRCTHGASSDNYFKLESISSELLKGIITSTGQILCYPHKPRITEVTSFEWRSSPSSAWIPQDLDYIEINKEQVIAWTSIPYRGKVFVRLSYTGGLFDTEIPADFQEAATVLAVRFYREIKSGLGDSIGVAELGSLVYTKAWPVRVLEMIQPYVRVVPWT
jgi:hypothetical protein